jgi:catechol 2,3-dioxygenase-like lactoylglutathione lyase family enzyme
MGSPDSEIAALSEPSGPPSFNGFHHVSLPCADLEEGIRFFEHVLGGELLSKQAKFALFQIAGTRVGIGSVGTTFMTESAEYPHIAFGVDADALVAMKQWLSACGIPTSNFWTRKGIETLMFFRDPSGNVIELFCDEGFAGAEDLDRGPARGHGITIDIDELRYSDWHLPVSAPSKSTG